ncbi:MAG: SIMPL domain-containing protein [Rhodospirillales bacterium]|nr:SIMPL domain-containing protein [Rhodospirillales bacterium]
MTISPKSLILLLGLVLAAPAHAAGTKLSLSETASVQAAPDEVVTVLRVSAAAPSAAVAQAGVNRTMAAALGEARKQAGLTISTGGYSTWQRPPGSPGGGGWTANQDLTLTTHDGAGLLHLVGRLQGQGLAVESLAWTLSPLARRAAEAKAMAQAIGALRGRAEQAAALLGLRFVGFRSVTLGAPPSVLPRPMFAGAALAAAPPPSAVGAALSVSATVAAVAELARK